MTNVWAQTLRTKSTASWLVKTSHKPSDAITTKSSPGTISVDVISGSAITSSYFTNHMSVICWKTKKRKKHTLLSTNSTSSNCSCRKSLIRTSPIDRVTPRQPLTRCTVTQPTCNNPGDEKKYWEYLHERSPTLPRLRQFHHLPNQVHTIVAHSTPLQSQSLVASNKQNYTHARVNRYLATLYPTTGFFHTSNFISLHKTHVNVYMKQQRFYTNKNFKTNLSGSWFVISGQINSCAVTTKHRTTITLYISQPCEWI